MSQLGGDMLDLFNRFAWTVPVIKSTVDFALTHLVGHHLDRAVFDLGEVKLLMPLTRTRKVVVSGNAYRRDPAGLAVMFKPPTALIGPDDTIILPRNRTEYGCVWEIELALVIGKRGKYIEQEDAYEHIGGYTIYNDMTYYGKQLLAYDTVEGRRVYEHPFRVQEEKVGGTFCSIGPSIAQKDEVSDPHSLSLKVWQNGKQIFAGSTDKMLVRVEEFVAYFSNRFTLEPGDIINTDGAALAKNSKWRHIGIRDQRDWETEITLAKKNSEWSAEAYVAAKAYMQTTSAFAKYV
jgi:2-keto-4-pentenoate hydratase/2-oxohepta-3-ene-1,7-dioic acid hydratase in catechol pathway